MKLLNYYSFFSEPSSFDVYPKENDLLMFPSWVLHSVPKSESNSERIVVAGNIQAADRPYRAIVTRRPENKDS